MHGDLGTYIAHVVIRGIIYKTIFRLPFPVVIVLGAVAVYYLVGRKTLKARRAKVKK